MDHSGEYPIAGKEGMALVLIGMGEIRFFADLVNLQEGFPDPQVDAGQKGLFLQTFHQQVFGESPRREGKPCRSRKRVYPFLGQDAHFFLQIQTLPGMLSSSLSISGMLIW